MFLGVWGVALIRQAVSGGVLRGAFAADRAGRS